MQFASPLSSKVICFVGLPALLELCFSRAQCFSGDKVAFASAVGLSLRDISRHIINLMQ
jgi:hypothetical protein